MSDLNSYVFQPLLEFAKNSVMLIKKCTKPDRKGQFFGSRSLCVLLSLSSPTVNTLLAEFTRIALATGVGFCIMGFIGFFVKLIHIPINNSQSRP